MRKCFISFKKEDRYYKNYLVDNFDKEFITLHLESHHVELFMNLSELLVIVIVSIPLTMGISNIMLANNICDLDDDIVNHRYTLPIYIGKDRSMLLF